MSISNKIGQYHMRPYRNNDRAACLALFDSNVPKYFAFEERKDFDSFLDEPKGYYFVMEDDKGAIVACGGYAAHKVETSMAVLCWGMVHRDFHRRGIGYQLLAERLERIAAEPQFSHVRIDTSQHSRGFFERFGFVVKRILPDGFALGLDLVEMELDLSSVDLKL